MKIYQMAHKVKERWSIEDAIRSHLNRNQTWLAKESGITEPQLSRKLNKVIEWTQDDLDKINKVLGTDFKL